MTINLKYFLIPYLAFSLTTAYASLSESSDDEGEPIGSPLQAMKDPMGDSEEKEESASASTSGPKVLCGHKHCQEKLDARLRGEASGSEHGFLEMGSMLEMLAGLSGGAEREDYSGILRDNAPTGLDAFDPTDPDVRMKGVTAIRTKFVFQNKETEAKRRVLTLINGTRLAFYESKMNALQFFVSGSTEDMLPSTYFAQELVRFGNVALSPKDGFNTITARLTQAGLMTSQDTVEEEVTVTYVKRLELAYEMNLMPLRALMPVKGSVESVSNVNIIDPSLVPGLAVDTESDSEDSVDAESDSEESVEIEES